MPYKNKSNTHHTSNIFTKHRTISRDLVIGLVRVYYTF